MKKKEKFSKKKIFFSFLFYFNQKIFLVSLHSILAFSLDLLLLFLLVRSSLLLCFTKDFSFPNNKKKNLFNLFRSPMMMVMELNCPLKRVAEISFSVCRKKKKEKFDSHFLACSGLKRNYSIFFLRIKKRFHQQQQQIK